MKESFCDIILIHNDEHKNVYVRTLRLNIIKMSRSIVEWVLRVHVLSSLY